MEELDEMEEVGSDYHVRERRTLPGRRLRVYIDRGATPVRRTKIDYIVEILNLGYKG